MTTDTTDKRVVLITGCSAGGMGYAVARELHSTGRYKVFASARSVGKMDGLAEGISKVTLDVTSEESIQEAIQHILGAAGRIDILINNAGVNAAVGPAAEVSLDNFQATFDVNVFGVIRVTQAAARSMIDYAQAHPDRPGMIINIGSSVGVQPMPWSAAYNSSKAAIHSYSDTLRMELAPFGIRVQVVAPGKIQSHFGVNGSEFISASPPSGSRYAHVWNLIQARAMYSQSPSPAPMPSEQFAKALRKHMEAYGALGKPRGLLRAWCALRSLLTTGAYLFVGPMSKGVFLLAFLPWAWRDAILTRTMGLAQIGRSGAVGKKNI